jgi:uncharacterized protein
MASTLVLTGWAMGLVGGPHCVAMCGAACTALSRSELPVAVSGAAGYPVHGPMPRAAPRHPRQIRWGLWYFQGGRLLGYGALGAVAASSLNAVGWLTVHSAALRPLWTALHGVALLLGLMLLWQARQPAWVELWARHAWQTVRSRVIVRYRVGPLVLGVAWALLPCGLLYSALMVAMVSGNAEQGALVMMAFAAGSSVSLAAAPLLWHRLAGAGPAWGQLGVRVAGASLAATAIWALWMGIAHNQAPWCVAPV